MRDEEGGERMEGLMRVKGKRVVGRWGVFGGVEVGEEVGEEVWEVGDVGLYEVVYGLWKGGG